MKYPIAILALFAALALCTAAQAGGHGGFGASAGCGGGGGFSSFGGGMPYGGGFNAGVGMGYGVGVAAMPQTVVTRTYAVPVMQQVVQPVAAVNYGVASPAFGVGAVSSYGTGFGVAGVNSFGVAAPYAVGVRGVGVSGAVVATPRVGFLARRLAGRRAARQVRQSLGGF